VAFTFNREDWPDSALAALPEGVECWNLDGSDRS